MIAHVFCLWSSGEPKPPNGLPFSCRERAGQSFQNATDLVRSGQLQCRIRPRELYLNPRQAIRTQQQRQFPGVGQVVVEETPDRLPNRYLLLGDSVGG